MPTRFLGIYLNDHLALTVGMIELAKRAAKANADTSYGVLMERAASELGRDKVLLEEALRALNHTPDAVKQAAAWAGEKLGRLKLNGKLLSYSPLSRVLEVEAMIALHSSSVAAWEGIALIAKSHPQLGGLDLALARSSAAKRLTSFEEAHRAAIAELSRHLGPQP